jgi:hypothetical protein
MMRALPRRFVSFAVAVGLGVTPPVAFAAPQADAVDPEAADPVAPDAAEPAPPDAAEPAPPDAAEPLVEATPPLDSDDEPEPPLDSDDDDNDNDEPSKIDDPDVDDTLDHDAADGFDDDYQVLRDSPEARTARRWLTAGIAATVTGAVLVGGAIAMGQTDPCDFKAGNNCFNDARDRAAVTLGAPGGLLLIGGITMTIVGALQRRRLWNNLAFMPAPNGLVVSGRF